MSFWDEINNLKINKVLKTKYNSYKTRSKKKGINFNLHEQEFAFYVQRHCYICNKENALGLDRIDNKRGYELGNIHPCCFDCNRMKSDKSIKEFVLYLKRLNPNHPLLTSFNKINNNVEYIKKVRRMQELILKMVEQPELFER